MRRRLANPATATMAGGGRCCCCGRLWSARGELWASWGQMFWVMVVPHLLLLDIIGKLWVVYLTTEFGCTKTLCFYM